MEGGSAVVGFTAITGFITGYCLRKSNAENSNGRPSQGPGRKLERAGKDDLKFEYVPYPKSRRVDVKGSTR